MATTRLESNIQEAEPSKLKGPFFFGVERKQRPSLLSSCDFPLLVVIIRPSQLVDRDRDRPPSRTPGTRRATLIRTQLLFLLLFLRLLYKSRPLDTPYSLHLRPHPFALRFALSLPLLQAPRLITTHERATARGWPMMAVEGGVSNDARGWIMCIVSGIGASSSTDFLNLTPNERLPLQAS